jgi:putative phosphoesterase
VLIAIIADTHMPRGSRKLPQQCVEQLRAAELILHAGDVSTVGVLEELSAVGPPVLAVRGNVDEPALAASLPTQLEVELDGARLAMTHDAGPAKGRIARLRKRFPRADAVVFGHSHIPLHETDGDFQIFNPGSPTERRRELRHTMGLARAGRGTIAFERVTLTA